MQDPTTNVTYIGLASADSMFPAETAATRVPLSVDQVREMAKTAVSCCNVSHANTLDALKQKHGIEIAIPSPEMAPKVSLKRGDSLIVMSVRGLPRLTGDAQYTDEQIENATFAFGLWTVVL